MFFFYYSIWMSWGDELVLRRYRFEYCKDIQLLLVPRSCLNSEERMQPVKAGKSTFALFIFERLISYLQIPTHPDNIASSCLIFFAELV